jgi:hypothetical protein
MKRIIRLTESDLVRIVRRVINEAETNDGLEKLKGRLVNKTVNFYTGKNEKQDEYYTTITIKDVNARKWGTVTPNILSITDEDNKSYGFACTGYDGYEDYVQDGAFSFKQTSRDIVKLFNKDLSSLIRSEYCQTKRDNKGNLKTVPPADFASTGGGTTGMA